MNRTLSTILVVLGVVVVAGGLFFAGTLFARTGLLAPRAMMSGYGWSSGSGYGPGTANGRGSDRIGPGMMGGGRGTNGFGPGMMGGSRGSYGMGPGMMGAYGQNNSANAKVTPLTVDQAKQAATKYVQSLNVQGLEASEVMIFDNNAYVVVKETASGLGAFELLVDPASQTAYPEPGPNMMWNLKYGALNHGQMMGGRVGMMGIWSSQDGKPADVSAEMPITPDQAIKDAQAYLDQNQAGATAATDPVKFYGYYTLDFTKEGKIAGMLSVNGYNGQVFFHAWHASFVEEAR